MTQTSKQVLSLRRVRLASVRGHVVIVEAGTPTRIPAALFLEAAKNGCVDYNPQMIEAFKQAVANAEARDVAGDVEAEAIDINQIAKDAVKQVLLASKDHPELLTAKGLPRTPAVRSAYEALCAQRMVKAELKITIELIEKLTLEAMDEGKPEPTADEPAARYPEGIPEGDLEGEQVGGDLDSALKRVVDVEE